MLEQNTAQYRMRSTKETKTKRIQKKRRQGHANCGRACIKRHVKRMELQLVQQKIELGSQLVGGKFLPVSLAPYVVRFRETLPDHVPLQGFLLSAFGWKSCMEGIETGGVDEAPGAHFDGD